MPCQFWWGAFDFKKNSGVIGTVRTSPNVMGKFKKRHNGMKQTREPPNFDIY